MSANPPDDTTDSEDAEEPQNGQPEDQGPDHEPGEGLPEEAAERAGKARSTSNDETKLSGGRSVHKEREESTSGGTAKIYRG